MGKAPFFKLYDILAPFMSSTQARGTEGVCPMVLSRRYLVFQWYCVTYSTGGDPTDIADHHGVKVDEMNNSLHSVLDAIQKAPEQKIVSRRQRKNSRSC